MRRLLLGAAFTIGLVSPMVSNARAVQLGDLRQAAHFAVEQVQYGGYCERLRRACIYKYERGEVGEGNCRRVPGRMRGQELVL